MYIWKIWRVLDDVEWISSSESKQRCTLCTHMVMFILLVVWLCSVLSCLVCVGAYVCITVLLHDWECVEPTSVRWTSCYLFLGDSHCVGILWSSSTDNFTMWLCHAALKALQLQFWSILCFHFCHWLSTINKTLGDPILWYQEYIVVNCYTVSLKTVFYVMTSVMMTECVIVGQVNFHFGDWLIII